ncbi:unnamed protein product [Lathyrus sativus]|nr:unnamed protein product [Lathyrus sativus]
MLTHSMTIYALPLSLTGDTERAVRIFIWSGETSKNKTIIVAWNNICKSINEGGLGMRSIFKLNEASNLKLAWDTLNFDENRVVVLRERVTRNNKFITYYVFSSIWSNAKLELHKVLNNSSCCLRNGQSIILWYNNWRGSPLFLDGDALTSIVDHLINIILVNGVWDFSKSSTTIPISIQVCIRNHHIPFDIRLDKRCWNLCSNGDLPFKFSYDFKCYRGNFKESWRWIWNKSIPQSKSFMVWRILHNKLPIDK